MIFKVRFGKKPAMVKKYAKPISLHPLKPEDAISAILQVKPPAKSQKRKPSRKKGKPVYGKA